MYSLSFLCLSWRPAPPTTSKTKESGLRFQVEKESEKFKMRLDAHKSFAQMHEDRNMNEGIGGQMMKLDPVVAQESKKERLAWKPQSSFQEGGESNNFTRIFIRMIFNHGGCHWIIDLGTKRPCETKVSRSDWEHLLVLQPSSWVGSVAAPFPLFTFLGAIRKLTDCFMRIHWRKPYGKNGEQREARTLDLGTREQKHI